METDLRRFSRGGLGAFPTPIEQLDGLGRELGIRLSIKRDDYSGFGGGGNKVRKLEYLLADAVAQKADMLITTGAAQSNHARMTAAAACHFGMEPLLVLRAEESPRYQGNLLLDRLFGATFDFIPADTDYGKVEDYLVDLERKQRDRGRTPYLIPLGGASPLGTLGYVRAVEEMAGQFEEAGAPAPDVVVAPVGSGGTVAGLMVGARRFWPGTRVLGVSTSRSRDVLQSLVCGMANECASLLQWDCRFAPEDVLIDDRHVGPGYGKSSAEGTAAILRLARHHGILLDPVYTGKAMAGLIYQATSGEIAQGTNVMFVHCGGTPALFSIADELVAATR